MEQRFYLANPRRERTSCAFHPVAQSPSRPVMDVAQSILRGLCSVALFLMFSHAGWACPGCKDALFDPGELPRRLAAARGYALSIGLLLVVPLGLVAGLTVLIVRASRRHQKPV